MGNIKETFKRFFGNKNTVTILAAIVGVLVLYGFYNYRVNSAITTEDIPYAIIAIGSGKKIETDKEAVGTKKIAQSALKDSDIVTKAEDLEGKYVCTGTSIPEGGFFYASQLCDEDDLPNSVFYNIPDGYTLFSLSVDVKTTYANSISAGDYIDLYLSAVDDDGLIIFGKLIESIEVLAVRDSRGNNTTEGASQLLFAVPDEYHTLLNIAQNISSHSVDIVPVPRGASYTQNPGETSISSESLYNFIMSNAATIID